MTFAVSIYNLYDITKNSIMKIKQLKDSPPCKFDLSFADMFIRPALEEFIRWRKTELKKPFKTPRGIHRLYNRLVDFSRVSRTDFKWSYCKAKRKNGQMYMN